MSGRTLTIIPVANGYIVRPERRPGTSWPHDHEPCVARDFPDLCGVLAAMLFSEEEPLQVPDAPSPHPVPEPAGMQWPTNLDRPDPEIERRPLPAGTIMPPPVVTDGKGGDWGGFGQGLVPPDGEDRAMHSLPPAVAEALAEAVAFEPAPAFDPLTASNEQLLARAGIRTVQATPPADDDEEEDQEDDDDQ